MAKGDVIFKENDEYYTPLWVVRKTAGYPDFDPATTELKAKEFGVEHYATKEIDGLYGAWFNYKNIWINPPFTLKKEFVKKAVKTVIDYKNTKVFILLPIETLTTNWFYDLNISYNIYMPRGRIKFENPLNPKAKSPAFGSVIVEFGYNASNKIINITE